MVLGVGGCGIGDHGALDNKELHEDSVGTSRVIYVAGRPM